MKIGKYEIGSYPAIIKKIYDDGSIEYETNFSSEDEFVRRKKAINDQIFEGVETDRDLCQMFGLQTSCPKVLMDFNSIRGEEKTIKS